MKAKIKFLMGKSIRGQCMGFAIQREDGLYMLTWHRKTRKAAWGKLPSRNTLFNTVRYAKTVVWLAGLELDEEGL